MHNSYWIAYILLHLDIMAHVCDVTDCNKSFKRRDRWIGGPTFVCDHCRVELSSSDHLRRHAGRCMVRRVEDHCAAVFEGAVGQPISPQSPAEVAIYNERSKRQRVREWRQL